MGGTGVHNPADVTGITANLATILVNQAVILAVVQDTNADLMVVDANVDDILAVTNALPTLSETGGTVTTDGTEQNVYINAVPLTVFNPICVKINCSAHTVGETIVIRTYYDIEPGGAGLLLHDTVTYVGVIDPPIITIDLDPNRYGVRVTIEKTVGTNRAYIWEVFYEI